MWQNYGLGEPRGLLLTPSCMAAELGASGSSLSLSEPTQGAWCRTWPGAGGLGPILSLCPIV